MTFQKKNHMWHNQYSPCFCEGVAFTQTRLMPRLSDFNRPSCGPHRQRGSQFAFESIQPLVWVIRQARYGLRGVRVGEASHPGPESLGVVTTPVDPTLPAGTNEISLTERDVPTDSCSDTESCCSLIDPDPRTRSRRLRLVWDPSVQPRAEQQWHREAREVEGLFRTLAGRVGVLPEGAPYPRAIRQQRWSPVNVPLMWAAAGDAPSTPALDWMIRACQGILEPVEFHEGTIQASEAVRVGWSSLREVFRTWGIDNREQLTPWLRFQGFPATLPGNHISARAQEFLLAEAGRQDARVGLIEVVCVNLAIHMGREAIGARPEILPGPRSSGPATRDRVNVGRVRSILDGGHLQDQGPHVEELPALFARTFAREFPSRSQGEAPRQNGAR